MLKTIIDDTISNNMRILIYLLIFLVFSYHTNAQSRTGYLTKDDAWCWFSDPLTITVGESIITGWIKVDGIIEAARLDTSSDNIQISELYYKLETDDHDNPAFI